MTQPLAVGPVPAGRILRTLATLAGLGICLLPVVWAIDPAGLVHRYLLIDQFLSLELGLGLSFAFLTAALESNGSGTRRLNLALVLAACVITAWLVVYFGTANLITLRPTPALIGVSATLIAVCLIASWKGSGADMVIMIAAFLVFGYIAQYLPSWIGSAPVRPDSYITYMVFGSNGLLGQALQIISTSVVIFILFGTLFEIAGGAKAIAGLALLMSRHGRGAAIKVCVIASGIFGMISGSATSNVMTAGAFSIPGMKKIGVPAATAAGIEAVASTCGQIMPPVMGAAAFLMANVTGISYTHIALAAVAPALLCYIVLFLQAERLGQRIEAETGPIGNVFDEEHYRLSWFSLIHLVPVGGMVAALILMPSSPELAGIIGTGLAAAVAVIARGPRGAWQGFIGALPRACRTTANLVVTASTIGIILAVIGSTGLDAHITILISSVGQSSLFLSLLLTSVAAFVLGLGISTSGVYIVAGTLLAPGLVQLGVPEIAAHMFVLFSAMLSMITPPVAFASLAASGLAGAGFNETSNEAMKFGWILFFLPFLIALSPGLVLVGDLLVIATAMLTAAVFCVVAAQIVYSEAKERTPLAWLRLAAAAIPVLPGLPDPLRLGIAGASLAVLVVIWLRARALRSA